MLRRYARTLELPEGVDQTSLQVFLLAARAPLRFPPETVVTEAQRKLPPTPPACQDAVCRQKVLAQVRAVLEQSATLEDAAAQASAQWLEWPGRR